MSFLYYNDTTPDTDANFRNLRADNVLQKNPDTGEYERVGSGSGGEVLPIWVKESAATFVTTPPSDASSLNNASLTFGNVTEGVKTLVDKTGVQVDGTLERGSYLSPTNLTFAQAEDVWSFDRVGAKNLAEIGSRVSKATPTTEDQVLIYDSAAAAYKTMAYTAPVKLPSYLYTIHAKFVSSSYDATIAGNYIIMSASLFNRKLRIDPSGIRTNRNVSREATFLNEFGLQTGQETAWDSSVFDMTKPYTFYRANDLMLTDGVGPLRHLDYVDVGVTNNLKTLANVTPGVNSKMVTYDSTTKVFSHRAIPTPVAPTESGPAKAFNWAHSNVPYNGLVTSNTDGTDWFYNPTTKRIKSTSSEYLVQTLGSVSNPPNSGDIIYFAPSPDMTFTGTLAPSPRPYMAIPFNLFGTKRTGEGSDPLPFIEVVSHNLDKTGFEVTVENGFYASPAYSGGYSGVGIPCNILLVKFLTGSGSALVAPQAWIRIVYHNRIPATAV